jgi:hypothetical protein
MSTIRNAQLAMVPCPKLLKYRAVANPCNYRQPTDCIKEERLLLMAGSQAKVDIRPDQRVAPIDLYTGVMFESLRKWLPDLDVARILILSAKHGLIGKEWPKIAPYHCRHLTQRKAKHLIENGIDGCFDDWGRLRAGRCAGPSPRHMLKPYSGRRWHDVFIVGGAEYRQVFHAFVIQLIDIGGVSPDASINEAVGSIGEQQRQFEDYLKRLASFSHETMLSGGEETLPQSGC